MKKTVFLLILLTGISFSVGRAFYPLPMDEEKVLMKGFDASGAQLDTLDIHIDLKNPVPLNTIKSLLDYPKSPTIQMAHKEVYHLSGQKHSLSKIEGDWITSIDIQCKDEESTGIRSKVKKRLEEENIQAETFLILRGRIPEKIDEQKMRTMAQEIFGEMDTDYIEGGFIRENFLTATGYTRAIKNHITAGRNRVNVNLALKYNAEEKTTHIILATPLIYGDY